MFNTYCTCFGNGLRQPCRQLIGPWLWSRTEEARLPPSLSAVCMQCPARLSEEPTALQFVVQMFPPHSTPNSSPSALVLQSQVNEHGGGWVYGIDTETDCGNRAGDSRHSGHHPFPSLCDVWLQQCLAHISPFTLHVFCIRPQS